MKAFKLKLEFLQFFSPFMQMYKSFDHVKIKNIPLPLQNPTMLNLDANLQRYEFSSNIDNSSWSHQKY